MRRLCVELKRRNYAAAKIEAGISILIPQLLPSEDPGPGLLGDRCLAVPAKARSRPREISNARHSLVGGGLLRQHSRPASVGARVHKSERSRYAAGTDSAVNRRRIAPNRLRVRCPFASEATKIRRPSTRRRWQTTPAARRCARRRRSDPFASGPVRSDRPIPPWPSRCRPDRGPVPPPAPRS